MAWRPPPPGPFFAAIWYRWTCFVVMVWPVELIPVRVFGARGGRWGTDTAGNSSLPWAVQMDGCWSLHKNHSIVGNETDFKGKLEKATHEVLRTVGVAAQE